MKLSDYFEVQKPHYLYIKIIPHKSIRNYNSANLCKAIAHTYRSLNRRIYKLSKKLIVEANFKVSFFIDIDKYNTSFYFIVPKFFLNICLEKIKEIWSKATVEVLEEYNFPKDENRSNFQLTYKKEDALSLLVDKKSNEPLNNILPIVDILKNDDKIIVFYNFLPRSQFGWIEQYEETIKKLKNKECVDKKNLSFEYVIKTIVNGAIKILESTLNVLNDLTGNTSAGREAIYEALLTEINSLKDLSNTTLKKKDQTILPTQIMVSSYSEDKDRREINGITVAQSFRCLDEDNQLMYKKVKNNKFKYTDFSLPTDINILSTEEGSNLIQIPGRSLLTQYGINHIKTEEQSVPEELQKGYITLGVNTCKGKKVKAYLEDNKDIGSLPLVCVGRQGSGKTTYITNYVKNANSRKEGVVHIDFIKNNESSKDIADRLSTDDYIILDFSTEEGLQALAYNEIKYNDNISLFERQALANRKTVLTLELMNSINEVSEPMSSKMERYFCAAADIIYLDENATLKYIIKCLQDYKYRSEVIKRIPDELQSEYTEEINSLRELDEYNKKNEIVGTKDSKIEGILDRVNLLKRDFYLKKMFNLEPTNNIDFAELLEEGKVILVRLPQAKFKNYVKNVITTFILTKCWLSAELRGELNEVPKRTHIIVDEISQTPTAETFMESNLTQTRKFGMKYVIAGQYLNQLNKKTIYSLKGAGSTFMLLKGAIKEDFEYFKEEIGEDFTYDDLKNIEEYSSFNLVTYSKGFTTFITKLPYKK